MNAPRHIWRGMGMGVLRRIWLARDAARVAVEMSMMEDGRTDRDPPGAGADPQILNCEAGLSAGHRRTQALAALCSSPVTLCHETARRGAVARPRPHVALTDGNLFFSTLVELALRPRVTPFGRDLGACSYLLRLLAHSGRCM